MQLFTKNNESIAVDHSLLTMASVLYDAVYVPGGQNSVATLAAEANAVHFLNEAFKHCKAIAVDTQALPIISATYFGPKKMDTKSEKLELYEGVIVNDKPKNLVADFIKAIAQHRFWEREKYRLVPA